jgi:hypothetical protein
VRSALTTLVLSSLILLAACSDEPGIAQNDPRYPPIAGLIATAVDNYASRGPYGVYPYMTGEVTVKCTEEQFAAAVGRRPDAAPLKSIEKVSIRGDEATVTLNLITAAGDDQAVWKLERLPNASWAVLEVPGSESCTP